MHRKAGIIIIQDLHYHCNNKNKTEEYNVYTACLVINCASNGKLYLYDIVDIKKEASNPLKTENSQVVQNRFF